MSSAAIHHRQRGLTLLEMLVAMTIMALSITVIYRAIAGSARGVEQVDTSQHAMHIMQSLLDAYPLIDPRQLSTSGQDGTLQWSVRASPYTAAAAAPAAGNDSVQLYLLTIDIQSASGRQWQTQTLRPLLTIEGRGR